MKKATLAFVLVMLLVVGVRAADLQERWIYVAVNLVDDGDTSSMVKLIGDAKAAGVTHVQFNDYQSAMMFDMGPRFFANVEKVKKAAKDAGIIIAPDIFPLGMSGRYLYRNPNLADSLPVRNMRFVVKNGEAVVDPSLKPQIVNGGFDTVESTAPAAWQVSITPVRSRRAATANEGDAATQAAALKDAQSLVAVDTAVKHSGAGSLRVGGASGGQRGARFRAGASQTIKVQPFHTYRLGVWMKTEGATVGEHPLLILGARDKRQLCYSYYMKDTEANWPPTNGSTDSVLPAGKTATWSIRGTDFGLKGTDDWAQYKVAFNSLDYDEIEVFAGTTDGGRGTTWYDDIELEPAGLLNVVRRDLTPLTVTSADGKTTYVETVDYKRVEDPKLGVAPSRGDFQASSHGTFEIWHQAPSIKLTENSRIKDGETLLVSFYAPGIIYSKQQITASMSDPATFDMMEQEMRDVVRVWGSSCYVMGYDEIRSGGWELQPGGAHLTPGQLMANHMKRAVEIAHKYAPGANLYVWSDMFDPTHNAGELKAGQYYYLVNGSWAGSWEGLPKDVIIYNWSGNGASAKWFADRGNRQYLSSSAPERWLDATVGMPGIIGMSYTNWEGDYTGMAGYFARMKAWKPGSAGATRVRAESTGR